MTRKRHTFDARTGDYLPAMKMKPAGRERLIRRETNRRQDPLLGEIQAVTRDPRAGVVAKAEALGRIKDLGHVAGETYAKACLRSGMTLEEAIEALPVCWYVAEIALEEEANAGDGR